MTRDELLFWAIALVMMTTVYSVVSGVVYAVILIAKVWLS